MPTSTLVPAAVCAILAAACGQDAAGVQATVPATVTTALEATVRQCIDVGGQPRTEKAVQRADLNHDGRDDFVLYTGWIECEGAASIYGDREKGVTVFAGRDGGGAAEAFSDAVYGAAVEVASARATLWLTTSGQGCGSPPARDFASETFCDRALVWNGPTGRFDYAPVSTVRLIK
jgi:hypothetical protein